MVVGFQKKRGRREKSNFFGVLCQKNAGGPSRGEPAAPSSRELSEEKGKKRKVKFFWSFMPKKCRGAVEGGGGSFIKGAFRRKGEEEKSQLCFGKLSIFLQVQVQPGRWVSNPNCSGSSKINNYHGAPKTPMDMKMEKVLSTKKGQQHNSSTMADVLSE